MDVRNCKRCRRLFNYTERSRYCPACTEEIEREFQEAKEYIYKHPGVGIHEVAEALEIEASQIKQWIREERLMLSNAENSGIYCENCGESIATGRFCSKCKSQITDTLSNAVTKKEAPKPQAKAKKGERDRMRFLDK